MSPTTIEKEKKTILDIAKKMQSAGLSDSFVVSAIGAANNSKAIYKMMLLWNRERDVKERQEIIADLQDMIDDSKQVGKQRAAYIRFDDLDGVAKDIRTFKNALLEEVQKQGGIKKLADLTGIPQPSLSRFFNSTAMPQRGTLLKFQAALKLRSLPLSQKWIRNV